MAKTKKVSAFKGKVSTNTQKQKNDKAFGYLHLPKDLKVYTPTPGAKENIDILPYIVTDKKHPDRDPSCGIAMPGELWYKRPFRIHRNIGAGNDTVVCLSSFDKKCPICEYKKKRIAAGADKAETDGYKTSLRNLYIVIPRGNKKLEEVPHLFDMSQALFQNKLNEEIEENPAHEVFPDIEEGLTLKIRWTEETFMANKYAECGRIDFQERGEAVDIAPEDVPCLDGLLKELSYAELQAKFMEEEIEEDEEDEEEEEIEDEIEEEEDEIEETPRKKKTSKPVVEEEEEEEEEEIEEAPKKKESKPTTKKATPRLTWDDLADMDSDELSEVIIAKDLDIDLDDFEDLDELTRAVAEALDIEAPKKKATEKPASKKAAKAVIEEDEDEEEEEETPKKKAPAKASDNAKNSKVVKGKCPNGFTFGKDWEEYKECAKCALNDACSDAQ